MDLTLDQTVDLLLPSTIYTDQDVQDNLCPSLIFAPGELGNLSLFSDMPPLQQMPDPWALENFGYSFDGPHVFDDGRMEGALLPPDYYAYSPARIDTWEEGLQTIGDFDWLAAQEGDEIGATHEQSHASPSDRQLLVPAAHLAETQATIPIEVRDANLTHAYHEPVDAISHREEYILPVETAASSWVAKPLESENIDSANTPLSSSIQLVDTGEQLEIVEDDMAYTHTTAVLETKSTPELQPEAAQDVNITIVDTDAEDQAVVSKALTSSASSETEEGLLLGALTSHIVGEGTDLSPEFFAPASPEKLSDPQAQVTPDDQHLPQTPMNALETRFDIVKASQDLLLLASPEEKPDGTPILDLPTEVPSLEHYALSASRSSSAQPSTTEEQLQAGLDRQRWDTQLQDAAAEGASDDVSDVYPPGYVGSEDIIDGVLDAIKRPNQVDLTEPIATPQDPLSLNPSPDSGQFYLPSGSQVQDGTAHKRSKILQLKKSSDTEAEAPVKKKQKNAKLSMEASEKTQTTVANPKASRRSAKKSSKKPSKDVTDDLEAPEGTLALQKSTSKPAEIYFEEDTRPSEDRPAELNRVDEDVKPLPDDLDYDMQEHYSDVQTTPTPDAPSSVHRAPRNIVSNRELEALGSTLAPGMHLGLHLYQDHVAMRVRKRAETPVKDHMADNSFFLVEDEREPSLAASKKKRAGTTPGRKAPAPKRAKVTMAQMQPQPRVGRGKRKDVEAEVEDGDEQNLFLSPIVEKTKEPDDASTLVPVKIISQKQAATSKAKKPTTAAETHPSPHDLGYGKRHTRGDTKLDDDAASRSASATPSVIGDVAEPPSPEEAADESYTTPEPTPKNSKRTTSLLKTATTSRTSTPTPSTASSPLIKNSYGFLVSPRKTRSTVAKTPASKEKGKATLKSQGTAKGKGKQTDDVEAAPAKFNPSAKSKGKAADVEPSTGSKNGKTSKAEAKEAQEPDRRTTRRASAVKLEGKEANIKKRLRSGD
ncbi:hypothetical protein CC86DRAFT_377773 [Ophiobolus disseminans]|uniref:Uncharacterized protein n=1 Tax=Ophiobolus disseminans TaxID=1469910 RepID=A0A6A7AH73_9PLEO|nr:hypothetical protein CC86DRAFT_377773 [Ophiobolus disseminans]